MTDATMAPITDDVGAMTSEALKAYRNEHGLTRSQVAALLGVAAGTVRNWEQQAKGSRRMPAPASLLLRRSTRAQIERVKREHPPKRARQRQPREQASG